jgi:hypothetical protein
MRTPPLHNLIRPLPPQKGKCEQTIMRTPPLHADRLDVATNWTLYGRAPPVLAAPPHVARRSYGRCFAENGDGGSSPIHPRPGHPRANAEGRPPAGERSASPKDPPRPQRAPSYMP